MLNVSPGRLLRSEDPHGLYAYEKVLTHLQIDLTRVLKKEQEAVKFAEEELVKLCQSWDSPEWDELDWHRLKDIQLRGILDERRKATLAVEQCSCIDCPNFLRHVCLPTLSEAESVAYGFSVRDGA